jgi:hypothetical protein
VGFEPTTPNLGGWCSIREKSFRPSTSPFARAGTNNFSIRPELPAQPFLNQLPKIQSLLLHLERKGRSKRTILAYEKKLKALAQRANLDDPPTVELAIARYAKKPDYQNLINEAGAYHLRTKLYPQTQTQIKNI